ncbi:hypothetical protein CS022_06915 [Veronia nyctiphanis]|uniref:Membrane fusion protein (MFP) family protein n=1 Tax=Veronia nyctiphanis TaxID=1278244 RepID=A0A4Q0YRJ1_9GAMM|nr:HlyD family efflux transporter periplasmic adaptor subunit [Veronia nyctiphanis]RXJ73742.1 hypothetical protein CS022_06915 [Veronia nyctiphanis]
MPDMKSRSKQYVRRIKRDYLMSAFSQYLLSKAFFSRIAKVFNSSSEQTLLLSHQGKLNLFVIHPFGCYFTTALLLIRSLRQRDMPIYLVVDDKLKGYMTIERLQSICDTLTEEGRVTVYKASEIQFDQAFLSDMERQAINVIMPTTISAGMQDFASVKFLSKTIQLSACLSTVITHQRDCAVYTIDTPINIFNLSSHSLTLRALSIRDSEAEDSGRIARQWLTRVVNDMQQQVLERTDQWLEWILAEKFYGRPDPASMGVEMKENFGSFVSGRVEVPAGLRMLCYGLLSFFVTALIMMGTVKYSPSDAAPGYLLATDETAVVKSEYTGQVISVDVEEGSVVGKDQLLYRIKVNNQSVSSSTLGDSLIGQLQKDMTALNQRIKTLKEEHVVSVRTIKKEINSKIDQLRTLDGLMAQQQSTLELLRNHNERIKSLYRKDLTSRTVLEQEKLKLLNAEKEMTNYRFRKKGLSTEIDRLSSEIKRRDINLRLNVEAEALKISSVEKQLLELSEDRVVSIYANKSGVVNNLKVASGDTIIVDGREIMEITPSATEKITNAVVFIPTGKLVDIDVGKPLRVVVDAFPVSEYGSFTGRITRLSSSTFKHTDFVVELPRGSLYYKADVEIYAGEGGSTNNMDSFKPGMLITADILGDKTTLFEWLFEPFIKAFRRVF